MKRLLVIFSILISCVFFISTESKVGAYLTGYSPVTYQITRDNTPTIEGSLRSWCDDVVVGIGTDQSNTNDYVYFYSDYGEVHIFDNGYNDTTWYLDLSEHNYGLINGVYNVFVASACGYPSYSSPFYADLHYGAISVIPDSCDSNCVPVYRFYNTNTGVHFYTTTEHEKRNVLDNMPWFRYEGISSYAKSYRTLLPGMIPVHRFYNFRQGVHFYTANQAEATNINNNLNHTYKYEGVAYQTYRYQAYGTTAVHRFYKFNQGVHFFTSSQKEASYVNGALFNTYRYEGISYYNITNK